MTQVSYSPVELDELVRYSEFILEVAPCEPFRSTQNWPIHNDSVRYPPYELSVEHYTVIAVLKGEELKSGDAIEVLPADVDSGYDNHSAYCIEGLGVSSHYKCYKPAALEEQAESKIVCLRAYWDGRYEYAMFNAHEDCSMREAFLQAIARQSKDEHETAAGWHDDPLTPGPQAPNESPITADPFLHPDPFSHPDPFGGDPFTGSPFPRRLSSAQSANEARYPIVHPEGFLANPLIANALATEAEFEGLKLYAPTEVKVTERQLYIAGVFQHYVACGAQLTVWYLFPGAVRFSVQDLLNGETYLSCDYSTMNISHGSDTIATYGDMPCDRIVKDYFALNLFEHVAGVPLESTVLTISAEYLGKQSEPLTVSLNVMEST